MVLLRGFKIYVLFSYSMVSNLCFEFGALFVSQRSIFAFFPEI